MRKLAPSDAIIYLETNNVAEMLESLSKSRAFQELAADKIDFSALQNMQMAIVITGFESSEKQADNESSILNFKPKFVAVAETHLWSWQTLSFAENQINNFVFKNFGQNTKSEKVGKYDGKFFTWTAADNRQIFAFVEGSLIYFGNDAAAIESCLAVKNGQVVSLEKNESLTQKYSAENLAFGYVSPAGVAQISNLAGVIFAVQTTDEIDERSFIARILPQILQKTTREIVWTASKIEGGTEDKFTISLTSEVTSTISEILAVPVENKKSLVRFLPSETVSATRYNLKDPLAAWRNLLLLTARNTDAFSGKLLIQFSDSLLEPYGISDAEKFLSSVETEIITAQLDENGEKSAVIVEVRDMEELKKSLSNELDFKVPAVKRENAELWFSKDNNIVAAFVENNLVLGDEESVVKCLQAGRKEQSFVNNRKFQKFTESTSVAATFGRDFDSAEKIAGVLANAKRENKKLATFYLTETNLSENGFERKTVSDFGLIGAILKQMAN